jgi:sulfur carrier protein
MEITVNGDAIQCDDNATVADVLAQFDIAADAAEGIAVAVNDAVVPRGRWAATALGAGDSVEIIHAVQGG